MSISLIENFSNICRNINLMLISTWEIKSGVSANDTAQNCHAQVTNSVYYTLASRKCHNLGLSLQ